MKIELIYDGECPHVEATRDRIREALGTLGLDPSWAEWRTDGPEDPPDHVVGYGSPTVLVDGRDVMPARESEASARCCRVYAEPDGAWTGVPPLRALLQALEGSESSG